MSHLLTLTKPLTYVWHTVGTLQILVDYRVTNVPKKKIEKEMWRRVRWRNRRQAIIAGSFSEVRRKQKMTNIMCQV